MTSPTIVIKAGREKPINQQHPWIFSGAIDEIKGDPQPGDIVTVTDKKGRFLARGYWNVKSQIQVRILTWQDEPIDDDWWHKMLKRAIEARAVFQVDREPILPTQIGIRLVNAENDYLPGLILDVYGDCLVLQALTLGIDLRKNLIAELAIDILNIGFGAHIKTVFERSDVDVRHKEGLKDVTGVLWGEEPDDNVIIHEDFDIKFAIDVRNGHKTGFYLDQKSNRSLLHTLLESRPENQRQVLNLFSYTGGFGIYAMEANAELVVNVDSSESVLNLAEKNATLSGLPFAERGVESAEYIQADVFELLHDYADEKKQFDVVILDPPKFAHNAGQVDNAARGYKDINLNAFKCVKPGGYLMTFSCSGAISADLFQKIVFGALADSGRQAQILKHLGPGDDHPVALTFPEGAYLKGLLLKVY
jgi:23S rRNA (cytosine1962-C5)-methyltransferase